MSCVKRAFTLDEQLSVDYPFAYCRVAVCSLADGCCCVLLETDAPYLAPVPHRGQRNESAYLPLVAAKVAEIKGLSLQEVEERTTENAVKLFRI